MAEVETALGKLRRSRGISAIRLAAAVGVSRQTVYAMEAGTYVPNTAVALRLARELETTVEALFTLTDRAPEPKPRLELSTPVPGADDPQPGQAVQLCRVDGRLMAAAPSLQPWYFPEGDAVVAEKPARAGQARVQIFEESRDFSDRILVAGCDPGISVLARHARASGLELAPAHRNSSQALSLLKRGFVHVAGTHLKDERSGESNLAQIERMFPKDSVAVISFAFQEEGIVTARGNPKGIRGVEDFARPDISIVNREEGSGSRALLDSRMKQAGLESRDVKGYTRTAPGHLPAAWQVQSGAADCCIATGAAARILGLHFIPLVSERYDLAIRRQHLDLPGVRRLLDTLSRSGFRRELEALGGYDTRTSGQRLV